MTQAAQNPRVELAPARLDDVDELVEIENRCFEIDRMSARSMRHMIQKGNCDFIIAIQKGAIVGYILVLYHSGTHLARIYSLAVLPEARGQGVGELLLQYGEKLAASHDSVYMRLEVHPRNHGAIRLYERNGYLPFGIFRDYYEDHADAMRFQKRILHPENRSDFMPVPYYQQTTDFNCGPAALMMAMHALDGSVQLDRSLEFQLWREATTIYMTSGHGGCSPLGLALAAWRRGFRVEVYLNTTETLFLDGVRSEEKKEVMELVHRHFLEQIRETDIELHYEDMTIAQLEGKLRQGGMPIALISTYRFNSAKTPHWVAVTGADDTFIYIHDPEVDEESFRYETDNIYLPIAHQSFDKSFRFGSSGLRTCVVIHARGKLRIKSLAQERKPRT